MERKTVNIFRALGDPNRIRILKMLEERELCVCEVREVLNLSTSTVSKHLSILRDADLILDWKDGKWVNYKLNTNGATNLIRPLLGVLLNLIEVFRPQYLESHTPPFPIRPAPLRQSSTRMGRPGEQLIGDAITPAREGHSTGVRIHTDSFHASPPSGYPPKIIS